jgi:CubicO group peptidase (beta-lactamase class C family)
MKRFAKTLAKIFAWAAGILLLVAVALYATGYGYLVRAVGTVYFHGHVTAFLDDYQYFENRKIENAAPQPWPYAKGYNSVRPTNALEAMHRKTHTVAFLIFRNDSLWSESYYDGYDRDSRSNSFSMAKSVVSAALGKAIMQGKVKSLDEKVADFYPHFSKGKASRLTLGDLSSMASGLNWDENYYSPFSITTRAYFDKNLEKVMLGCKVTEMPGQSYKYLSGNTQLLAMCLQKAAGKPLSDYVSENFWKPMGFEHPALWQTDHKNGDVKAYCCIASPARDFGRFGKLYEHFGNWNGTQILDSAFVAKSVTPRFKEAPWYGYGWWIFDEQGHRGFYMRGHLGQYVIVVPDDHVIIVRLGSGILKNPAKATTADFDLYLRETYRMLAGGSEAIRAVPENNSRTSTGGTTEVK